MMKKLEFWNKVSRWEIMYRDEKMSQFYIREKEKIIALIKNKT